MSSGESASIASRLSGGQTADKYVIWAVLVLSAVGIVAVYSAISFLADTKSGGDTERFLLRHVSRLFLALIAMFGVSLIDYRKLARVSRLGLMASLLLLVAVHLMGVTTGGASRWLQIGAFAFQPSDLAKVALVLYVGLLLARKQHYIKSFSRGFLPLVVWILATCALIGLEDLSTGAIVLMATILMCFVGRVSMLHLGGLGAVGALLAFLLLLGSPNRAARVEAYLGMKLFPNTEASEVFNQQDEGYQAQQARIAIAMGGLTGVGPGKSVQRDFLPAPYNDFIFAIIAEEYGLAGALTLLGLFLVLLFRGFLRIARHAPDPLGLFIGVGFTSMVTLYGFIHAAVACSLVPVTGLPMPFVSYGGTSMVATGLMIGVVLNISRQSHGRDRRG